ncbi:MAG: hypothetical protein KGL98_08785 [Gammaproteobacteria bacterium]|nr:hypothetical protein [Gammaproteobacteria bacterium]
MHRLLMFLPLLLLAACSVQQQEISVPAQVLPAVGVTSLNLDVNVGRITITPSSDGQVHLALSLQPSTSFFGMLTSSASLAAVQHATISHMLNNGALTLGVQYPANTDSSNISEHWTVALPPTIAVTSKVNVGELNVSGVASGVDANLNVGKVQLDVPGGPLKIIINVGKVQATVRSLDYSDVALGASIGKVGLTLDGVSTGSVQKTTTGENLDYTMKGKNRINLQVTTGSVQLALLTH